MRVGIAFLATLAATAGLVTFCRADDKIPENIVDNEQKEDSVSSASNHPPDPMPVVPMEIPQLNAYRTGNNIFVNTRGKNYQFHGFFLIKQNRYGSKTYLNYQLKGGEWLTYAVPSGDCMSSDPHTSIRLSYSAPDREYFFSQQTVNAPSERRLAIVEEEAKEDDCRNKAIDPGKIVEYFETPDERLQSLAKGVAVIIDKKYLQQTKNGFQLNLDAVAMLAADTQSRYGKPLALNQAFGEQYRAGIGTAFLGSSRRIITAGHCVYDETTQKPVNLSQYYVIFNFLMSSRNSVNHEFSKTDVYCMKRVVDFRCNPSEDWAVVELDRLVKNHPVPTRSQKAITKDTAAYVVGHPLGLPMKIELNADIHEQPNYWNPHRFFINLNIFRGYSGSPIFNAATNEVVGIVTSMSDMAVAEGGKEMIYKLPGNETAPESCNVIQDVENAMKM